jgi:predicted O-methyltransferase YrrM
MIHQSKSYIKFIRLSKNRHGVHSPFVYDLVTKCFNDKKNYPEYELLKAHRKALRRDDSLFEMTDFGEGSRVFKGNARKVSAVVKNAGMKKKRQKLLLRLARYVKAENVLELGTSLGLGTVALSLSNTFAAVNTVEGCPNTLQKAQHYFEKFNLHNIAIHQQLFSDYLDKTFDTFDLIFIDGDHNGARTLAYFHSLLKNVHNDSVIIFDDIYWSKDMTAAWQRKEHFVIRV